MAEAVKLCKDCRSAELQITPTEKWICSHRSSLCQPEQSPVTGRTYPPYQMDCRWARFSDFEGRCGPQARYWQARVP